MYREPDLRTTRERLEDDRGTGPFGTFITLLAYVGVVSFLLYPVFRHVFGQ